MRWRRKFGGMEVEAFQVPLSDEPSSEEVQALHNWTDNNGLTEWESSSEGVILHTAHHSFTAYPGDYIVKGNGMFWVSHRKTFELLYECLDTIAAGQSDTNPQGVI